MYAGLNQINLINEQVYLLSVAIGRGYAIKYAAARQREKTLFVGSKQVPAPLR